MFTHLILYHQCLNYQPFALFFDKIEDSRAVNCDSETFSLVVAIIFLLALAEGVDDFNGAEAGKGEACISETERDCGSFMITTEEVLRQDDAVSTVGIVGELESTLEAIII